MQSWYTWGLIALFLMQCYGIRVLKCQRKAWDNLAILLEMYLSKADALGETMLTMANAERGLAKSVALGADRTLKTVEQVVCAGVSKATETAERVVQTVSGSPSADSSNKIPVVQSEPETPDPDPDPLAFR
jgi:hypothetical protein